MGQPHFKPLLAHSFRLFSQISAKQESNNCEESPIEDADVPTISTLAEGEDAPTTSALTLREYVATTANESVSTLMESGIEDVQQKKK